jgi:hypothetical protein
MKRRIFIALLVLGWCVGTASAQFGFGGIVYDPTNQAACIPIPLSKRIRCARKNTQKGSKTKRSLS